MRSPALRLTCSVLSYSCCCGSGPRIKRYNWVVIMVRVHPCIILKMIGEPRRRMTRRNNIYLHRHKLQSRFNWVVTSLKNVSGQSLRPCSSYYFPTPVRRTGDDLYTPQILLRRLLFSRVLCSQLQTFLDDLCVRHSTLHSGCKQVSRSERALPKSERPRPRCTPHLLSSNCRGNHLRYRGVSIE